MKVVLSPYCCNGQGLSSTFIHMSICADDSASSAVSFADPQQQIPFLKLHSVYSYIQKKEYYHLSVVSNDDKNDEDELKLRDYFLYSEQLVHWLECNHSKKTFDLQSYSIDSHLNNLIKPTIFSIEVEITCYRLIIQSYRVFHTFILVAQRRCTIVMKRLQFEQTRKY